MFTKFKFDLYGKKKENSYNNNLFNSEEGRKEMFYLTTHSTHFIYGYMASDIW